MHKDYNNRTIYDRNDLIKAVQLLSADDPKTKKAKKMLQDIADGMGWDDGLVIDQFGGNKILTYEHGV